MPLFPFPLHLQMNATSYLYQQLYEQIKSAILKGKLLPGEKLPSKRKLAESLQISQTTIETAYGQLVAEGLIEAKPKQGFFVLPVDSLGYVTQNDLQHPMPQSSSCSGINNILYDFNPGHVDVSHFPFSLWRKYARELLEPKHADLLLLGNNQGEYQLREQISSYLYTSRGVHCTPEQIILGAGTSSLLWELSNLLQPNTCFGIEYPGYHTTCHTLNCLGLQLTFIPIDEEGLMVDQIQPHIQVVYTTPSHQFPYGSILSYNRRIGLLNWVKKESHRYIIEDDYDSEFRYKGRPIPSLQSMDQLGHVIYMGTFSKSLMPSLRISYMVLPLLLLQKYQKNPIEYICNVPRIEQHILYLFLKNRDFEKHLNKMRKIYRRKLELLIHFLRPYQGTIDIIGSYAGFYVLLWVHKRMTEKELVDAAAQKKIKVYGLSAYTAVQNQESPGAHIILGFAGIPEGKLIAGLTLLLKAWRI